VLSYESAGRVKAADAARIRDEAGAIARAWWRGALGFDEEKGILSGATPLFHSSGIEEADDLYMAFCDAAFLVERLADWAKRFKVKWRLRMHDDDWGAVDPTGPTRPLLDQMDKWARRVRAGLEGKGRYVVSEERRAELLERHAGRRG
jgi:hypothetical protein